MINLLPPDYKLELARSRKRKTILAIELAFGFFLLVFALGLLAAYFHFQGEYQFQKALTDSLSLEFSKPEKSELKNQISNFNQDLIFIDASLQKKRKNLSQAIKTLSRLLQEKFEVDILSYDKNSMTISLSGRAAFRQDLLELKGALEAEPSLSEVYFPPANWVKAQDINFFFTLKPKEL